jgi:hypothetical protein
VKKASNSASRVQGTSNIKKSDVAKFATCSTPIYGVFCKMTSQAQHGNKAGIKIINIFAIFQRNFTKLVKNNHHAIQKTIVVFLLSCDS